MKKKVFYIIEYKYTDKSHIIYKLFDNFKDCNDYYIFLCNNLNLSYLVVKVYMIEGEIILCGN